MKTSESLLANETARLEPLIETEIRSTRSGVDKTIGTIVAIGNGTDALIRTLGTITAQTVRIAGSVLGAAAKVTVAGVAGVGKVLKVAL